MTKEALWKAVKEPLRLLVLAIIPFVLAYLGTINYQWAAVITAGLKFVDKLLHEIGKETDNNILMKGITGF